MRAPESEVRESSDSRLREEGEGASVLLDDKKDRYAGEVDPVTGLRNGKGRYKYSNLYFTYDGQWEDGMKHGYGLLKFSDGGFFEGEFKENQIWGYGTRLWSDGSKYNGYWNMGEKDGEGTFEKTDGDTYNGDWVMNVRHGGGKWTKPNKQVIEGEFINNLPQGHCTIRCSNGDLYRGNVDKGVINGEGEYKSLTKKIWYEGEFVDAKREGQGRLYTISGDYIYTGEFKDDLPTILPNQLIFHTETKEEDPADAKKKDPKKGEPEEDENPYKLVYEIGKSEPLKFEIRAIFQGEPYEDDTPVDEEELKKQAAKKAKSGEEPEVRMITPEPVIISQESGREFEFELGRLEDPPAPEVEEGAEAPPADEEVQKMFKNYKFNQKEEDIFSLFQTNEGVAVIEGIEYSITDEFKGGKYEIIVRDRTPFIEDHLKEIRISLEIIDPEEVPVATKGKKK